MEDLRCIQGMNRLRDAYHDVAPMIDPHLSTSRFDDLRGMLSTYTTGDLGASPIRELWHALTTVDAMVNVVTVLLIGVLARLVASAVGTTLGIAIVIGGLAFVVALSISFVAAGRSSRGWRPISTRASYRRLRIGQVSSVRRGVSR